MVRAQSLKMAETSPVIPVASPASLSWFRRRHNGGGEKPLDAGHYISSICVFIWSYCGSDESDFPWRLIAPSPHLDMSSHLCVLLLCHFIELLVGLPACRLKWIPTFNFLAFQSWCWLSSLYQLLGRSHVTSQRIKRPLVQVLWKE